ncbi:DUF4946 domain-containing protein [Pseudomonas sp. UBA4194]|jgi:hypothetical protein|uniref:DUF4946 domain-containing protein n=1 Tax=Pseudomonas sp. UBA4194 TaxID=1947317 RepID=UPI0025CE7BCD|nr:DUF4946 domain-containing protein [Pseudomonas sp. UBA4194]
MPLLPGRHCLLLCLLACGVAHAEDSLIVWPADWQVQILPSADGAGGQPSGSRQRATKNDANGDPLMIVEMTRGAVPQDHAVNLEAVLLEMRKAIQINFSRSGYQSLCTKVRETTLGDLPAAQTTCKVTLNGNHVITQTLVAAVQPGMAYGFSYAGSVVGYPQLEAEVNGIRQGLRFKVD